MWWIVALVACHPSVEVEYLKPADINLPNNMATVAAIDRVGSSVSNQAMVGLVTQLRDSGRLTVVDRGAAKAAFEKVGVAANGMISKEAAQSLCKATKANGIVVLDRIVTDDDWSISETTEPQTKVREVKSCDTCDVRREEVTEQVNVAYATYSVEAQSEWKVLTCDGGVYDTWVIREGNTWTEKGTDVADAKAKVGDITDLQEELVAGHGEIYANRISPYLITATREYFKRPHGFGAGRADFKEAFANMKDEDWDEAERLYLAAAEDGGTRMRARAYLNLAVAAEAQGKVNRAQKYAKKSLELHDTSLARQYLRILNQRVKEKKKLDTQLQPGDSSQFTSPARLDAPGDTPKR